MIGKDQSTRRSPCFEKAIIGWCAIVATFNVASIARARRLLRPRNPNRSLYAGRRATIHDHTITMATSFVASG